MFHGGGGASDARVVVERLSLCRGCLIVFEKLLCAALRSYFACFGWLFVLWA